MHVCMNRCIQKIHSTILKTLIKFPLMNKKKSKADSLALRYEKYKILKCNATL